MVITKTLMHVVSLNRDCYLEKNLSGFLDESRSDATIRHVHCQYLLGDANRCLSCVSHRATLLVQLQRTQQASSKEATHTTPDNHVNYR